jgi:hypothetical protein
MFVVMTHVQNIQLLWHLSSRSPWSSSHRSHNPVRSITLEPLKENLNYLVEMVGIMTWWTEHTVTPVFKMKGLHRLSVPKSQAGNPVLPKSLETLLKSTLFLAMTSSKVDRRVNIFQFTGIIKQWNMHIRNGHIQKTQRPHHRVYKKYIWNDHTHITQPPRSAKK